MLLELLGKVQCVAKVASMTTHLIFEKRDERRRESKILNERSLKHKESAHCNGGLGVEVELLLGHDELVQLVFTLEL